MPALFGSPLRYRCSCPHSNCAFLFINQMKGIEAVLPVCWFHSAVLGVRLNMGALSNRPIRKLAARQELLQVCP